MPNAETAYLFRHALLRDAAYQLQLPGDRARLHALCAQILAQSVTRTGAVQISAKTMQPSAGLIAAEIAEHCRLARHEVEHASLRVMEHVFAVRAAQFAESHFDSKSASQLWLQAEAASPDEKRGECLAGAATAVMELGELDKALRMYHEAQALATARRNLVAMARISASIAKLNERTGNVALAERDLRRAIELGFEAGDHETAAICRGALGKLYSDTGRHAEAEQEFEAALKGLPTTNLVRIAAVIQNRGLLWMRVARTAEARAALEQALLMSQAAGDDRMFAQVLGNLAVIDMQQGRVEEGTERTAQALAAHRKTGDRFFEGIALTNHAAGLQKRGETEAALQNFDQGIQLLRETGALRHEAAAMGLKAALLREIGKPQDATGPFMQAIAMTRQARDQHREGLLLAQLAITLVGLLREHEARRFWNEGKQILRELNDLEVLEKLAVMMREACAKAGVPAFDEGAP